MAKGKQKVLNLIFCPPMNHWQHKVPVPISSSENAKQWTSLFTTIKFKTDMDLSYRYSRGEITKVADIEIEVGKCTDLWTIPKKVGQSGLHCAKMAILQGREQNLYFKPHDNRGDVSPMHTG